MPTTVEDVVKFKNIPKSLCDLLGGIQTREGDCIAVVEINEENPNVAKLIKLEKRRGLDER